MESSSSPSSKGTLQAFLSEMHGGLARLGFLVGYFRQVLVVRKNIFDRLIPIL